MLTAKICVELFNMANCLKLIHINMDWKMTLSVLIFFASFVILDSYRIEKHELFSDDGSISPFKTGTNVTLTCRGISPYEYCHWYHDSGTCKFEWKYSEGKIQETFCSSSLTPRLEFVGDYEKHDCSIKLHHIRISDEGKWRCRLQSYILGPIPGDIVTENLNLRIENAEQRSKCNYMIWYLNIGVI